MFIHIAHANSSGFVHTLVCKSVIQFFVYVNKYPLLSNHIIIKNDITTVMDACMYSCLIYFYNTSIEYFTLTNSIFEKIFVYWGFTKTNQTEASRWRFQGDFNNLNLNLYSLTRNIIDQLTSWKTSIIQFTIHFIFTLYLIYCITPSHLLGTCVLLF